MFSGDRGPDDGIDKMEKRREAEEVVDKER